MRRSWIFCLILLCSLVIPVQAQTPISFDEMQVKLWPEYDQPGVLVIMDMFLAETVDLPARVTIQIPKAVGEPHSVAVRELDGMLYLLDYEKQDNGDWLDLTFTTPYPEVWLEYYDPSIQVESDVRSFTYEWPGNYTVDSMLIEVQQPYTATDMVFKQSMGSPITGNDGMVYFTNDVGEVKAGTGFQLDFSYIKDDDILSNQNQNQQSVVAAQPVTPQTKGRTSFAQILPILLAVLGVIVIGIGAFWYFQNKQRQPAPAVKRHQPRIVNKTDQEGVIFCHQCGKRANSGDVFCRSCGTRLRVQ
jgi:hypothetical protein